jgi:hypothetical protein
MYKIVIEIDDEQVYEQKVEALDMKAVIDAVNRQPQPQRKTRSDAGVAKRRALAGNDEEPHDPFPAQ